MATYLGRSENGERRVFTNVNSTQAYLDINYNGVRYMLWRTTDEYPHGSMHVSNMRGLTPTNDPTILRNDNDVILDEANPNFHSVQNTLNRLNNGNLVVHTERADMRTPDGRTVNFRREHGRWVVEQEERVRDYSVQPRTATTHYGRAVELEPAAGLGSRSVFNDAVHRELERAWAQATIRSTRQDAQPTQVQLEARRMGWELEREQMQQRLELEREHMRRREQELYFSQPASPLQNFKISKPMFPKEALNKHLDELNTVTAQEADDYLHNSPF